MLKLLSVPFLKEPSRPEFKPMDITLLCGNMQASRFETFDLARVKIARISWNLASLLILSTFVFSSLRSPIWKGESLSTDAVKVYNRCKKDITLLIVLISSDYFEQNQ